MKSRELIEKLLEVDPSGEAEVVISNSSISWVDGPMPGYYDGCYIKTHFDKELANVDDFNHHGVSAVEMGAQIKKIKLHYMTMEDAFMENPEAEWIANNYNEERNAQFLKEVEEYRRIGREQRKEIQEMLRAFKLKGQ